MDKLPIKVEAKLDVNEILSSYSKAGNRLLAFIFGPKYINRLRETKLSLAQIKVDEEKIITKDAEYDSISNDLTCLASKHIEDYEIDNIAHCLKHALPLVENAIEESVDKSTHFINRWRDEAKLISKEDIREIWGRVLAQEINDPDSISLRTLDVIKNLSTLEAVSFLTISKYVLFDRYVVDNRQDFLCKHLSNCRDAGLIINFNPGIYQSIVWGESVLTHLDGKNSPIYYIRARDYFIYLNKEKISEARKPNFTYWQLSAAGNELYNIVKDDVEIGEDELREILKCLEDGLLKRIRYTKYTNIENSEIDLHNISFFCSTNQDNQP